MTVAKWTPCAATKASVNSVLRIDHATGRGARATTAAAITRPENRAEYRVAETAPARTLSEVAKHAATTTSARPVATQMNARRLRLEDSSSIAQGAYPLSVPHPARPRCSDDLMQRRLRLATRERRAGPQALLRRCRVRWPPAGPAPSPAPGADPR